MIATLKQGQAVRAEQFEETTVCFTAISDFADIAAQSNPLEVGSIPCTTSSSHPPPFFSKLWWFNESGGSRGHSLVIVHYFDTGKLWLRKWFGR